MDFLPEELIQIVCYYFLGEGIAGRSEYVARLHNRKLDDFKTLRYFFNRLRCLSKINKHWYARMPWQWFGQACGQLWYYEHHMDQRGYPANQNTDFRYFYGMHFHQYYPHIAIPDDVNPIQLNWSQRFYYLAMIHFFHRPKSEEVRNRLNPRGLLFKEWNAEHWAMYRHHDPRYKRKMQRAQEKRKRTLENKKEQKGAHKKAKLDDGNNGLQ